MPQDSVKIVFDDKSVFRGIKIGNEKDSTYIGTYYSLDFSIVSGYHKYINGVFTPQLARYTHFNSSDTIYLNYNSFVGFNREVHFPNSYILDNPEELHLKLSKQYHNHKNEWIIRRSSYGKKYDRDNEHIMFDLDSPLDSFMYELLFAVSFIIFLFILLSPLLAYSKSNIIPTIITIIIIGLTIFAFTCVNKYVRYSIALPFLSLCIIWGLTLLIRRKSSRYVVLGIASVALTVLWIWYMFYNLDETVKLNDGKEVNIHWRAGTDTYKRLVIKHIFNNMCPIPIEDNGVKYTVYVSKYELTDGEFAIINDDVCGWLSWLFGNDVLSDFSYRESQIVLNTISNISGVKLDFLSYYEWQTTSCGEHHNIHPNELTDANEGEENPFGLVNITGNIAEYSNTYAISSKIGLSGDTLLPSFDGIIVCGNAFLGKQSDLCFVNKNLRRGGAGIRPVYRPENIGRKTFVIHGYLRNDRNYPGFPQEILLKSINGEPIHNMNTYEDFEEKLIESRFHNKVIDAVDITNGKSIKLKMPKGLCYYDFVPSFSYIGFGNKTPSLFKQNK
ncbi:MAG: hypothetical protein ACI31F_05090 [Muribaculaceae bacterium]